MADNGTSPQRAAAAITPSWLRRRLAAAGYNHFSMKISSSGRKPIRS
jgi:hypothetical protein